MEKSDDLIEKMMHEYELSLTYKKSWILWILASNKSIWENLAFYTNLVLNVVIAISYYEHYDEKEAEQMGEEELEQEIDFNRKYEPRLLGNENIDFTPRLLLILGIINFLFSGLVVLFFFIRKARFLVKNLWINWYES